MVSLRAIGGCCVALLFFVATAAAASSEVADAAMKLDKQTLRSLLQKHADVNAPQADGATALHWAVWRDDAEMADLLIRSGADVNAADRLGVTPIGLASTTGNAAIMEALLKTGADPNMPLSSYGDTPLMMAARAGKVDAIKALLDHHADVNVKETWGGTTAVMWAASEAHPNVVALLAARGADVNVHSKIVPAPQARGDGNMLGFAPRDLKPGETPESLVRGKDLNVVLPSGGLTPLMFAAREGEMEAAKVLLSAGADINAAAGDLSSALGLAIQNGHYEMASFFIDQGADIHHADLNDCTPLWLAVHVRNHDFSVGIPWVVTSDPFFLIEKLLKKGSDPNHRAKASPPYRKNNASSGSPWLVYEGATAFLRAAAAGDTQTMRLLLAYGADPRTPTAEGVTPLAAASGIGYMGGMSKEWSRKQRGEAVKFLIDLGLDVNAADQVGRTPLHGAASLGYGEVVQMLVDAGGRLDAKDKGGSTDSDEPLIPLDYAIGVRLFTAASPVHQPETEALIQKLMAERGIEHTTSECTLKGFTCGEKNPKANRTRAPETR
jgi:ankyrin repeat protein